jgi:hypothetical protein
MLNPRIEKWLMQCWCWCSTGSCDFTQDDKELSFCVERSGVAESRVSESSWCGGGVGAAMDPAMTGDCHSAWNAVESQNPGCWKVAGAVVGSVLQWILRLRAG